MELNILQKVTQIRDMYIQYFLLACVVMNCGRITPYRLQMVIPCALLA
jgi:hypothetical protein